MIQGWVWPLATGEAGFNVRVGLRRFLRARRKLAAELGSSLQPMMFSRLGVAQIALAHQAAVTCLSGRRLDSAVRQTSFLSGAVLLAAVIAPLSFQAQAAPSPAAGRLKAQNRLFEAQFAEDLAASPETRSAMGDHSGDDQLDDYSLAGVERGHRRDLAYLTRLHAISDDNLAEQDKLSHDLMIRELKQRVTDFELKNYEMPLNQYSGIHISLADIPNSVPLDSLARYESYTARLRQIPRVLAQVTELLRAGERDGLTPPALLLRQVPDQCRGVVAEDPFIKPASAFPATVGAQDRKRLSTEIMFVTSTQVLPAYRRFCAFIETEYAPHGRASIGLTSLPDGPRRYQTAIEEETTTNLTPDQIYTLGLSEISRISDGLARIARRAGYADLVSYRTALNRDPKYVPTSAEQIVDDFRRYVAQMEPRLPQAFLNYPRTRLIVEAIPASQPQGGTHHVDGSPDGSRAGRIVVATSNFAHRKLLSDEAQAYHEGVPGHELQVSIQQRLNGLPRFRSEIRNSAYVEGWAVYTEGLAKELGFFQDPASDYGRLNLELLRAVRLVVDTGIHARGWSRDQAVAYFRQSGCADEPTIQSEVDRYIALPAQGLSYKIGQLEILELRARAEKALGSRFDLRQFHDVVLGAGSLPLPLLDARVQAWITDAQRRETNMLAPRPG